MPDATRRPRFFVAPAMLGLGISRMFDMAVELENPLFKIVLSIGEALAALDVQFPQFEPLVTARVS